jgi:outer membrane protein assembly factor BamB
MLERTQLGRFSALLFALSLGQPLASQNGARSAGVEKAVLVESKPLNGRLYHVQGLDLDRVHIWITSVDKEAHKGYLHEFNRKTATLEREIEVTDGQRFHPGGISLSGGSVWVPVAEYRPHSSAVIEEIDTRTLTVKRRISVPDHVGCVAFTGSELIAGNWGSRQFYVLNPSGKVVRVFDNPSANEYQDIKFVGGMLVASGNLSATSGAIDWYRWPTMKLVRSLRSGMTDRKRIFTNEGMALEGNNLYLIPEDGPSRLFHFVIDLR